MNEIGAITFIVMFSIRLAVPFGLLLLAGTLVERRSVMRS